MIIKKKGITETIYNLHNFIEPRKTILTNGTLNPEDGLIWSWFLDNKSLTQGMVLDNWHEDYNLMEQL